jgi:stage V sporulation protein G
MIRITEVKVSLRGDEKLRRSPPVTLDGCFVIRGLKIIETARGTFVAMPARRKADGTFQDVAHPINAETRALPRESGPRDLLARSGAAGENHSARSPGLRADDEDVDDSD